MDKKIFSIFVLASAVFIVFICSFYSRYQKKHGAEDDTGAARVGSETRKQFSLSDKMSSSIDKEESNQNPEEDIDKQVGELIGSGIRNPVIYMDLIRRYTIREITGTPRNESGETEDNDFLKSENKNIKYTLSRTSGKSVAVNIKGGDAKLTTEEPEVKPNLIRTLQGRVIQKNGIYIADSPVLVAESFYCMYDYLRGEYGSTSDHNGYYSVNIEPNVGYYIMAIHPTLGWSQPFAIKPGHGPLEVDLILPDPGATEGIITRNGHPECADLIIKTLGTEKLTIHQISDPESGAFRFGNLPPGDYELKAFLRTRHSVPFSGGLSAQVSRAVTIREGKTVKINLDLPSGALLVAQTTSSDGWFPDVFSYYLFRRPINISQRDDLEIAHKSLTEDEKRYILVGGQSRGPMEFYDLLPGTYTLCIQGKTSDRTYCRQKCQLVPVHEYDNLIVTTVNLDKT